MRSGLWTPRQVANHLGVSVTTVYRWAETGTCGPQPIKFGNNLRFAPEDVERFIDNSRLKAAAS